MRFLLSLIVITVAVGLGAGSKDVYDKYVAPSECVITLKKPIPNGNLIWLDRESSFKMEGDFTWLPSRSDSWPLNIQVTGCHGILKGVTE